MPGIKLAVGLGNPGARYQASRHNAGFRWIDALCAQKGIALVPRKKYRAELGKSDDGVLLAKPQTFMNASGESVGALARYFGVLPAQILIIHDETDFSPGEARIKFGGGEAGHNGLRDISRHLSARDYWRLRIGVGRGPRDDGADYVLSSPSPDDKEAENSAAEKTLALWDLFVAGNMEEAMLQLHSSDKLKESEEA